MFKFFSFFSYYRLLGVVYFLIGLQLTFKTGNITILKYIGLFLIIAGIHDVITGTSMKVASTIRNKAPEKPETWSNSEQNTDNNVPDNSSTADANVNEVHASNVFGRKNFYLKFLKGNAVISIITLLIAFILFLSSGSIAKLYFKSNATKYEALKQTTTDKEVPASNNTTTIKLDHCSANLLNNKLTITANSIECSENNTIVNIAVDNKSVSSVQLGAINGFAKFSLVDTSGTSYNFVLNKNTTTALYDMISSGSSCDLKLTFQAIPKSTKIKSLVGQICVYGGGIKEVPFSININ